MLFSSLIFIFLFLPLVIGVNFLIKERFKNAFLLLASLVFFAWGGVSYSFILIFSLIMNFFVGKAIGKTNQKKLWLTLGIGINLANLIVFKYANFIVANINVFSDSLSFQAIPDPGIILPIGISFYTFQAISYLVDVYRGTTVYQKKFINLSLYISFFPQLIAGPIVRYHDIAQQLLKRDNSKSLFISGIERFTLGLGKKVLIANQCAYIADTVFASDISNLSTGMAWVGAIAYSFQIYFDFSGYSDMAIGLGRMFGFKFLENFNFPYIARSIQDFWRRWHISLSNWFRDYLYIPLGGNRKSASRTYINLAIVFFITGFWHGAAWNFVVWGLFHGFFLVLERLGWGKILNQMWAPFQHLYTLLLVIISWILFRAENFAQAVNYLKAMFSYQNMQSNSELVNHFSNWETYLVFGMALLGSTTIFLYLNRRIKNFLESKSKNSRTIFFKAFDLVNILAIVFVLLICTMYLSANTYNPFIYFRF